MTTRTSSQMYGRLIGQWATELSHVADVVGGTRGAGEVRRPGRSALRPQLAAAPEGRREVPQRQRLRHADLLPARRHPAEDRGRRGDPAHQRGAGACPQPAHERPPSRAPHRVRRAWPSRARRTRWPRWRPTCATGSGASCRRATCASTPIVVSCSAPTSPRSTARSTRVRCSFRPDCPPQFAAQFAGARATSDIKAIFRAELRSLDGQLAAAAGRATDRTTPRASRRRPRADQEDPRPQRLTRHQPPAAPDRGRISRRGMRPSRFLHARWPVPSRSPAALPDEVVWTDGTLTNE